MVEVSNSDRIVFPEVGRTKGDVVSFYERIAPRALAHLIDRPVSIRRYPKGLAGQGFFQKNVPAHYPEDIGRFAIPRSKAAAKRRPHKGDQNQDVTNYPLVRTAEHLAYLANQGAIELHVPTAKTSDILRPDRLVIDLDPPPGSLDLVRRAARLTRTALAEAGLPSVPVATGSKGYHIVCPIQPVVDVEVLVVTMHQFATLLAAKHPNELTTAFRIAQRGERVFIDWLRIGPSASVVCPYSLRARPRASVAAPLGWEEIDALAPDAFTIDDVARLLDRPDALAELALEPSDPRPFASAVTAAFEASGLVLEAFDRFRS
jgi:bifunctional non-homologous end joining protein LigD